MDETNRIKKEYLKQIALQNVQWFSRPMRVGNLTLVENDPGRFDIEFWLDYFKRTNLDMVTLSAGGIVAYYPTKIPFHHRSLWLNHLDPFGELVIGSRKLGLNIVARTDPHAVHQDMYEAHPEWIAVDSEGNKRRHWAAPELWLTCMLGTFGFEYFNEIHREIMLEYWVDGIFSNRWSGSGVCYCEQCRTDFKTFSGYDIPVRGRDTNEAAWRKYNVWHQKKLFQLWQHWDAEIRKINPNAGFMPNMGVTREYFSMRTISHYAYMVNIDKQGRSGLEPIWAIGMEGKKFQGVMNGKPVMAGFSVGLEEPYRWKDSVQSEAELRLWYADGIANGMRPSWGKFSGVLYDKRWLPIIERIMTWHKKWEKYFRNVDTLAEVGLVWSQNKVWWNDGAHYKGDENKIRNMGMYHALVENRIPFDMINSETLEDEKLRKYKVLILVGAVELSDQQCEEIRKYVMQGGSIIAAYETSLYDEWGVKRGDFGLADVMGVHYVGHKEGPIKNAYLSIKKDSYSGEYHPIVKGLETAGRIIHGIWELEVRGEGEFTSPPLTLIPSYPDVPMEYVYPRNPSTDIPEVYISEKGSSKRIYFPWDIDRSFWEVLNTDHGKLLANTVRWAAAEEAPVQVEGEGVLDVTVWRQKSSLTVHLVNLTNPMFMKGPCRDIYPIGSQKVSIRLPLGNKVKEVRLLEKDESPRWNLNEQGRLEILVPRVSIHEVIAVELGPIES